MPDYDATVTGRKKEPVLRYGISIKNFWGTPSEVYDALDAEFNFDLDAAAEDRMALCGSWLGLGHPDPLRQDALRGPPAP